MAKLENRTVNGWHFRYDEENTMFECRGEIMYDDFGGDEMPEPELWKAALLLERTLSAEGYIAEAEHSEKGWVEVRTWIWGKIEHEGVNHILEKLNTKMNYEN